MQQFLNTNVKLEASAIKKTSLSKKVWHQNCVNWVFWGAVWKNYCHI